MMGAMKTKPSTEIYESRFPDLFGDAVTFAWHSATEKPSPTNEYLIGSFVRASILNCALSVECAANCCLSSLKISSKVSKGFQNLTVFEHFNRYLVERKTGKVLNVTNKIVAPVFRLTKLRNDCVHPKLVVRSFFRHQKDPIPPYKTCAPLDI